MRVISIGFHDVVERYDLARPIAPGHTTLYTIDRRQFAAHLLAIRARVGVNAVRTINSIEVTSDPQVLLTFDDGALSGYELVAPMLEDVGWRAHFFVTTEWIGMPGFCDNTQIRDLHRRGHVIGSHSLNHPQQMAKLPIEEMVKQWAVSCDALREIVGRAVQVASVPGGSYSTLVARAAALSGVQTLFTSEPTTMAYPVDECVVRGRYTVRRFTSSGTVGGLAAGAFLPRCEQVILWAAAKAVKQVTGPIYPTIRQILSRLFRNPNNFEGN